MYKALSDSSFPSGHTLASFEAATVLMIRDKRFGIPALILAILVALPAYCSVHYPTDVLAATPLGVFIGIFACFLVDKIYKRFERKIHIA